MNEQHANAHSSITLLSLCPVYSCKKQATRLALVLHVKWSHGFPQNESSKPRTKLKGGVAEQHAPSCCSIMVSHKLWLFMSCGYGSLWMHTLGGRQVGKVQCVRQPPMSRWATICIALRKHAAISISYQASVCTKKSEQKRCFLDGNMSELGALAMKNEQE